MAFYNPNTYYPNNYYTPNYPGYATQGQQTIQNGGFVTVQSEDEAKAYPVAHGASVTFRDENQPYIYTKTLGFGQFDTPTFERSFTGNARQNGAYFEIAEDHRCDGRILRG